MSIECTRCMEKIRFENPLEFYKDGIRHIHCSSCDRKHDKFLEGDQ